jgi:hypothetical protein
MEYNTYQAILDLVNQMKMTNEKLQALEVKFFSFEAKLCDLDDKLSRVLETTEGVSSTFSDMNVTPEQVQGILSSFGMTGQAGGSDLVESLQSFRSRLGDLSSKLSQISEQT